MKNELDLLIAIFEKASAKRIAKWEKEHATELEEERQYKELTEAYEGLRIHVMRPAIKKIYNRIRHSGFKLKITTTGSFEQYVFDYPKEEDTSFSFVLCRDSDEKKIRFSTLYQTYTTPAKDQIFLLHPDKINQEFIEKHFILMLKELGK